MKSGLGASWAFGGRLRRGRAAAPARFRARWLIGMRVGWGRGGGVGVGVGGVGGGNKWCVCVRFLRKNKCDCTHGSFTVCLQCTGTFSPTTGAAPLSLLSLAAGGALPLGQSSIGACRRVRPRPRRRAASRAPRRLRPRARRPRSRHPRSPALKASCPSRAKSCAFTARAARPNAKCRSPHSRTRSRCASTSSVPSAARSTSCEQPSPGLPRLA